MPVSQSTLSDSRGSSHAKVTGVTMSWIDCLRRHRVPFPVMVSIALALSVIGLPCHFDPDAIVPDSVRRSGLVDHDHIDEAPCLRADSVSLDAYADCDGGVASAPPHKIFYPSTILTLFTSSVTTPSNDESARSRASPSLRLSSRSLIQT